MGFALLQGAFLVCAAWMVWAVARKLVAKSTLANVPGPRPRTYNLFGDMLHFFGRHAWPFHEEVWSKFGRVARINGFYGKSMLYVYDPKALHHILVKDQYTYEETPIFLNINRLVFGDSLLSSLGDRHKHQRKILNPVFHTNHMRSMIPIFYRIVHKLRDALANEVNNGAKEIEMLSWMNRTALELVGQGGLGYSFDDLDRDWENPTAEVLKSIVPTFASLFLYVRFLPIAVRVAPPAVWRWILERLPSKRIRHVLALVDKLSATSKGILAEKKTCLAKGDAAMEYQAGEGKDIMSVLLKANMHASPEDKMADDELEGHIASLLFAAMETTSGALARILQLLSEHQDVQEKLRQEIIAAHAEKEFLDFDELMNLPYLEAVCRESLRLHSPLTQVLRRATKDVIMPLGKPIRGENGVLMDEIVVPKDTGISVGILACNRSTAIWGPDAHEWKPERWLKPLPDSVAEARIPGIYSNLLTFLGGGRSCIGFKFSQLEMKVVLSVLLRSLKFSPSGKDVYWNFSGLQFPTVGTMSMEPQMPLRVTLIQAKT